MNKEDFLKSGLLEQYLLNLTDPEETRKVEQMLEDYPEIQEELDAMHNAIEQYAMAHSIPPPPHLKEKVMAEIADSERSGTPGVPATDRRRPLWRSLANTAAILGLGLLSLMLWLQNRGLNQDYLSLKASMQEQQTACEEKLQQLLERPLAFLDAPATKTVILQGTALSPGAEAIVFWNPVEGKACLDIVQLPEVPADKQYQIWADVEGEMINMGLIENHAGIQTVNFIAKAESFNITLEPKGGSEHPTVSQLQANGNVL